MGDENEDSDKKSKSVRIPLAQERFDEWEEAANEERKKKTELVREAVDLYISEDYVLESEVEQQIPEEVTDRLASIETQLDNLALETTEGGLAAPPDMSRDELIGLADTVRERIPVVADASDFEGQLTTGMISRPCHVDHLADVLDEDVDRVERALIYARNHMDVESTQIGDDRGWFRVIPNEDGDESEPEQEQDTESEPEPVPESEPEQEQDTETESDTEPETPADLFDT